MKTAIIQKILKNALNKFASQSSMKCNDIQLVVFTVDGEFVKYKKCHRLKPVSEIPFSDIYNGEDIFSIMESGMIKMANINFEHVTQIFLSKTLKELSQANQGDIFKTRILIHTPSETAEKLYFSLYVNGVDKGVIDINKFLN